MELNRVAHFASSTYSIALGPNANEFGLDRDRRLALFIALHEVRHAVQSHLVRSGSPFSIDQGGSARSIVKGGELDRIVNAQQKDAEALFVSAIIGGLGEHAAPEDRQTIYATSLSERDANGFAEEVYRQVFNQAPPRDTDPNYLIHDTTALFSSAEVVFNMCQLIEGRLGIPDDQFEERHRPRTVTLVERLAALDPLHPATVQKIDDLIVEMREPMFGVANIKLIKETLIGGLFEGGDPRMWAAGVKEGLRKLERAASARLRSKGTASARPSDSSAMAAYQKKLSRITALHDLAGWLGDAYAERNVEQTTLTLVRGAELAVLPFPGIIHVNNCRNICSSIIALKGSDAVGWGSAKAAARRFLRVSEKALKA